MTVRLEDIPNEFTPTKEPYDPNALRRARASDDELGPVRPCRKCGLPTRQAHHGGRVTYQVDVEGPHDPRCPDHRTASWWSPRWGHTSRVRGDDERHLAEGNELFVLHVDHCPAESITSDASPTKGTPRMTAPQFGTPGTPGEGVGNEQLQGKLLLITVNEKRIGVVTSAGATDCLATDIVDLETGEEHTDNLLFGKVLFGQLKPGTTYLGRIGKGVAQPGKSAPWLFTGAEGDPAAVATATQYLAYKAGQQPAAAPATPAFVPPAATLAPAAAAPPWAA